MSSFLASMRRLFESDDAKDTDQQEAKRQKASNEPAAAAAAVARPNDCPLRLNVLVESGWPARLAAQALEQHAYQVLPAAAWLQQNHSQSRSGVTVAASSSSAVEAASSSVGGDNTPGLFERLPQLAPRASPSPPPADAASSSSSVAPLAAEAAAVAADATWACSMCTFENHGGLVRCEMCDTARQLTATERAVAENLKTCQVCYLEAEKELMFHSAEAAKCGHYTCADCMRQYLLSKLDTGLVLHLRCPGDRCQRELSVDELHSGLGAPSFSRYERYKRLQELSSDPRVIFCPSASCEVALIHSDRSRLVCPDCSNAVCFACKTPWHTGLSCAQYVRWQSSQAKDLSQSSAEQTFQRFLALNESHFRQCKKCTAWIEKVEGCDKMTCRCGFQFCQKCGSEGARCGCTPMGHVFYPHETVLANWGRPGGQQPATSHAPILHMMGLLPTPASQRIAVPSRARLQRFAPQA